MGFVWMGTEKNQSGAAAAQRFSERSNRGAANPGIGFGLALFFISNSDAQPRCLNNPTISASGRLEAHAKGQDRGKEEKENPPGGFHCASAGCTGKQTFIPGGKLVCHFRYRHMRQETLNHKAPRQRLPLLSEDADVLGLVLVLPIGLPHVFGEFAWSQQAPGQGGFVAACLTSIRS
jgi:hypothetical protein